MNLEEVGVVYTTTVESRVTGLKNNQRATRW